MHGFPKHLNTKADFDTVHQLVLSGELPAQPLIEAYRALLNTRQHYVFERWLGADEAPPGPEPQYRVMEQERDGKMQRALYRLVDDPNARIRQLGFSVAEVEARMAEVMRRA